MSYLKKMQKSILNPFISKMRLKKRRILIQ